MSGTQEINEFAEPQDTEQGVEPKLDGTERLELVDEAIVDRADRLTQLDQASIEYHAEIPLREPYVLALHKKINPDGRDSVYVEILRTDNHSRSVATLGLSSEKKAIPILAVKSRADFKRATEVRLPTPELDRVLNQVVSFTNAENVRAASGTSAFEHIGHMAMQESSTVDRTLRLGNSNRYLEVSRLVDRSGGIVAIRVTHHYDEAYKSFTLGANDERRYSVETPASHTVKKAGLDETLWAFNALGEMANRAGVL